MRYLLLLSLGIVCACGATQWQRDQDGIAQMMRDVKALNSPETEKALHDAQH